MSYAIQRVAAVIITVLENGPHTHLEFPCLGLPISLFPVDLPVKLIQYTDKNILILPCIKKRRFP